MKKTLAVFGIVGLLSVISACGETKSLSIKDPWVRISGMNGAAYVEIDNPSDKADELNGATVASDVAGSAELHETTKMPMDPNATRMTMAHGDVMTMKPVAAIPIPAKSTIKLMPGGFHVMLMNVKGNHPVHSKITVTLKFKNAGEKKVDAVVKA